MYGFKLSLPGNQEAYGVIFPDASVYVHEPIADAYASMGDVLIDNPQIEAVNLLGPVVPVEEVYAQLEENFNRNVDALQKQRAELQRHYNATKAELQRYEAYAGPVNLMKNTAQLPEVKAA